jgi:RNA polymerase sigma factor (sigma-70 family)
MATTRRKPGTLPPTLTPARQAKVAEYHFIAVKVAAYHAKRLRLTGDDADDLLGEAQEALTVALATADLADEGLENYLWECVHGGVKDLLRRIAIKNRRGPAKPSDPGIERIKGAASARFREWVRVLRDPGDVWRDSREDAIAQLETVAGEGTTVMSLGAGGPLWNMRGEDGFALRAEWVHAKRELRAVVSELPDVQRAVVELHFLKELPLDDVATQTNLSTPTVVRRIGKALPLLRARLDARGVKKVPAGE